MGQPFAKASVSSIAAQADGSKQVGIQVQVLAGVTIATAELYYSEQTPTWPERSWVALDGCRWHGCR